jgi:chaperonin cofactor prefoldin
LFFRINCTFWDRKAEEMPTRGESAKLGPVTLETLNETVNSKINKLDERFDRFEALFLEMTTTLKNLKDDINNRFTEVENDIATLQSANIELGSRISNLENTNEMKQKVFLW